MAGHCDLQLHINGQQTFFINQKIVSAFSGKLRKMIRQEKKTTLMKNLAISLEDFPGGPNGFELISRFCYNNGRISITTLNVSHLYCGSIYLGMTEKLNNFNLLHQTESFLEGMFYWSWGDVLICLKNCEGFFTFADDCGLIDKLITTLLAKIAQNSDISLIFSSNSSSSSSPENAHMTLHRFRASNSSPKTTQDLSKPLSSSSTNSTSSNSNGCNSKAWWFDDLSTLSPMIVEKLIRNLGAFGSDNNSLLLTKFLLHYLKTAPKCNENRSKYSKSDYSGLADTAVYGVILMGKTAFSCRALFWVLRLVSGFGLSKVCRTGLERLIGSMLDLAKLDDLLVSGNCSNDGDLGSVYDVNPVIRLIRVFVHCEGVSLQRLKKVGWLVDQYLAEISPDHNLKISKFIGVAQGLPDLARDCFDGVYRAIDIYLESHPTLSFEERSRLCRCLNYEKLSLEACKDLAKNPRIPPRVSIQALASQKHANYEPPPKANQLDYYCESPMQNRRNEKQVVLHGKGAIAQHYEGDDQDDDNDDDDDSPVKNSINNKQIVLYGKRETPHYYEADDQDEDEDDDDVSVSNESEDMRLNIQRMRWRVLELEKLCREMKGQMTKLVRHNKFINSPTHNRPPRLC